MGGGRGGGRGFEEIDGKVTEKDEPDGREVVREEKENGGDEGEGEGEGHTVVSNFVNVPERCIGFPFRKGPPR